MQIAYLASPYSHWDPRIKDLRHRIVNHVASELMKEGIGVYSPLTHNLPLAELGIKCSWDVWRDYDKEMLSRCDRVIVLKIPGWEVSTGVSDEIAYAKELGYDIEYIDPPQDKLKQLLEYASSMQMSF